MDRPRPWPKAEGNKPRDPERLEEIRRNFKMLVTHPPLPPSAGQITAEYRKAVPWLIAEIERWQPVGEAVSRAAAKIAALTLEIEKLTAALEQSEARRGKHHG